MRDFALDRANMVNSQLRTSDVTDVRVVDAFFSVPREAFVDAGMRGFAYLDNDVALGNGRFLMEPTPLAKMIQALGVREGERALDVGGGTGYGAAILAHMGARVTALEEPEMAVRARAHLSGTGVTDVTVTSGPLTAGLPTDAPYDVILIEGSVDEVPATLLAQLADGGRLTAVVGRGRIAKATLFVRTGEDVGQRTLFDVAVPELPGFRKAERFEFSF